MKLSVSLPAEDVEFLDEYARKQGIESRSAALLRAVRLLKGVGLGKAYEEAWDDWQQSGEADAWEVTVADGLKGG
jgi:Arc/MetJ-type ribon-helix-helix transcriptional regulator